jgi:hypothetical protein
MNLDDYVDVATRIGLFYDRYPDGRLVTVEHGFYTGATDFVWCRANAYRTADDPHPAVGTAWNPIPGPNPFTRDSELMNAETSAWGRAIVAAGIPSKKVASADEVQARQGGTGGGPTPGREATQRGPGEAAPEAAQEAQRKAELRHTFALAGELDRVGTVTPPDRAPSWEAWLAIEARRDYGVRSRAELTAAEWVELRAKLTGTATALAADDEVPFS